MTLQPISLSIGRLYSNGKSTRKIFDIEINIELPPKHRERTIVYVKDNESCVRSCKESTFVRWVEEKGSTQRR